MGENGTFYCVSTGDVTAWNVNNATIDTERFLRKPALVEVYAEQDIFFSLRNGDNYTSILTITGTTENNFTRIQCSIVSAVGPIDFTGEVAFLRVLGMWMLKSLQILDP
jgi:hypothetical protein